MKHYTWLIAIAFTITFTGCIDILEELMLKKDGTGTYTFTMDMSGMFESADMLQMMQGMYEEEEAEELDPMMDNYLGNPADRETAEAESPFGEDVDQKYYLKELPEDERPELKHGHLMDKVFIHQVVNKEQKIMTMTFGVDFEKLTDIDNMMEDLENIMPKQDDNNMLSGMGMGPNTMMPPTSNGSLFKLKGKNLVRAAKDNSATTEMVSEQEIAMMAMFFAGGKYKAIYHLPGRVTKVAGENATSDENKVTVTHDIDKFLFGKQDFSLDITFR